MTGQLFYFILYGRDSGGTSYQQYLAQFTCAYARIPQRILYRRRGSLNQITGQFVKFRLGQGNIQMLRAVCSRRDKRQVNIGLSLPSLMLLLIPEAPSCQTTDPRLRSA